MFIIVFWLGSDTFPVSSTVSPKGSVMGCGSSLGGRVDDFSFLIVQVHFIFVNLILLCFFHLR